LDTPSYNKTFLKELTRHYSIFPVSVCLSVCVCAQIHNLQKLSQSTWGHKYEDVHLLLNKTRHCSDVTNVKLNFSLHLTISQAVKTYGGGGIAPRMDRFTPREITPDTHWIEDWMGRQQSRSGRGREEQNSQLLTGLEPPITQLITSNYTLITSMMPSMKHMFSESLLYVLRTKR